MESKLYKSAQVEVELSSGWRVRMTLRELFTIMICKYQALAEYKSPRPVCPMCKMVDSVEVNIANDGTPDVFNCSACNWLLFVERFDDKHVFQASCVVPGGARRIEVCEPSELMIELGPGSGFGGSSYKLSNDQVREIRSLYENGMAVKDLAELYGAHCNTIRPIVKWESRINVC